MDLLDLIFPKKCLECGREGDYICASCLQKLNFPKPICPECTQPSIDGFTHVGCKRSWGLDGLVSIWSYEGVIRRAILGLKYKFAYEIATELAGHLASYLQNKSPQNQFLKNKVLVPIPLHWFREGWRGFNQSEEIGKLVTKKMNWRFIPNLLVRKKVTIPQAELDREKRLKNVQGIFAFNPSNSLSISQKSIILFDDVWTTGATLRESAKVLKRNGAKRVWGLTLARGVWR